MAYRCTIPGGVGREVSILPGGRGFFGNRVVRGESWRQWRLWGWRSDVARPGLEPGALRQGARRVDELTGVTGSEGPGFHTPRQPAWRGSEPPKPPPDAKAIFLRWLAAASAGDRIGANDALAELEELAVSPRTKIDDSQAGPDRY